MEYYNLDSPAIIVQILNRVVMVKITFIDVQFQ